MESAMLVLVLLLLRSWWGGTEAALGTTRLVVQVPAAPCGSVPEQVI